MIVSNGGGTLISLEYKDFSCYAYGDIVEKKKPFLYRYNRNSLTQSYPSLKNIGPTVLVEWGDD